MSLPSSMDSSHPPIVGESNSLDPTHQINDWGLVAIPVSEERRQRPTFPHVAADPALWDAPGLQDVFWENDQSGRHRVHLSTPGAYLVLESESEDNENKHEDEHADNNNMRVLRCAVAFPAHHGDWQRWWPQPGDSGTAVVLDVQYLPDEGGRGGICGPQPVGVILGGPGPARGQDPFAAAHYTFIQPLTRITERLLETLGLDKSHYGGITYAVSLSSKEAADWGM